MQLSGGLVPSPADHSELVAELEPTPPMAPVGMGDTQPWHLSLAAVPAARVPVHTSPDVGDPDAFSSIAWLRVPDTSPVQFAATTKRETLETTREAAEVKETGDGIRLAQGRFLDELPGAAFAAVTLIWVIGSFAGLMWQSLPADFINHVHALTQLVLGSHAVTVASRAGSAASIGKNIYDFVNRNPADGG